MEFAAAALTAVAGAGEAAGGLAAAAPAIASVPGASLAAGVGSLLPSAATGFSVLSAGATVFSALAAQRQGEEKAYALTQQAGDAETDAKIENVDEIQRRGQIRKALLQSIGERDVATAASGVDLSFGTPVLARQEATRDAENAIATDDLTSAMRVDRLRERAANYSKAAIEARSGGLGRAAAIALEGGARILRRG